MNTQDFSLSRRTLLQTTGALVIAFNAGGVGTALAQAAGAVKPPLHPTEMDSWIAIAPDGSVTIFFGKIDGGQGTDVAIAQIVAEEMDISVSRINVIMGDTALTCNQGGASGSTGVAQGGAALRQAGAEARRMLVERAAIAWGVAPERLSVNDGVITIAGDPRSMTCAALIGGKYFNDKIAWNNQYGNALGLTAKAKPKTPDQYRVVGTSAPRADVRGKVFAYRPYVTDIKVEGMLHERMIRPENASSVPVAVDEASIRHIPGAQVVHKNDFLGVVAPKEWDAIRAARDLKVTWSAPVDVFPGDAGIYDHLRASTVTKRQVTTDKGAVEAAFAGAARIVEAEYEWPYQSHASMAGGCAIADVRGDRATVWTGTQKPHYAAEGAAAILKLPLENVHGIWVQGPGSYGRNDAGDALMDACVLSQTLGRPVRVQYMRHEGTGWDPKGPPSVHKARAALDAAGNMIALEFTSRGMSRNDTDTNESEPKDTLAGQLLGMTGERLVNFGSPEGAYEFPVARIAWETVPTLLAKASPLRTTHLRDPIGPQVHFGSESFMDEVAEAAGVDPIEFRLKFITRPRDVAALKAVAEKAGWKPGPAGTRRGRRGDIVTGQGVAYASRGGTIVAMIAEVEVNMRTGQVYARKFTVAQDCGLVINPGTMRTVIEGNVVQGLSRTLHEEVKFDRRGVKSVDWLTYPILDITEAPETVDIVLLDHPEIPPTGAGEATIRILAAAVSNAVFEATGKRIRRGPLTPERVRGALA